MKSRWRRAKYRQHDNQANGKLDQLVSQEKRFNTTTIFRETQAHNTQMTRAGKELYQASGNYADLMSKRALNEASKWNLRVEDDKKFVSRSDAPEYAKQEFNAVAQQIQLYAMDLDGWMKDGKPYLKQVEQDREDLRAGKHLELVDNTMATVIDKALEGEDLSRDNTYMQRP